MTSFEWLGGPTGILRHAAATFLIDPMLGPRGPDAFVLPQHPSTGAANARIARYTRQPHSIGEVDAIVLSHPHNDHFDATAKEILPKGKPLVVPPTAIAMVEAAGFRDVRAIDWGESITIAGTVITAIEAHHAHDPALDQKLGRGNGYTFAWPDYRVYWTGDAVLTDASPRGPFDLALIHMGGVGGDGVVGLRSMIADEAIELVRRIDSRIVIPIHHTSFSHYREPIEALEQRAADAGLSERFRFPVEQQVISL
ncbi:MAG: MBL fold metallo-hydrolase [Kofleriaceae bacterium]